MNVMLAIILAIVQGITELFPISSLGHAVILPAILGWKIDEHADGFLPFLVVMHLGTALALLIYFARDWRDFATAVLFRRDADASKERRLFYQVVVATIPAVIFGFTFEHLLRGAFASAPLAAIFLVLNGVMLFGADRVKVSQSRMLDQLRWRDALLIGFWQCLALIPGLSRSGATMVGGYLSGLKHEDAARFSFLTATPIILGAGVLEVPKLIKHHGSFGGVSLLAGVVAGITAFVSVAILMRWFRAREIKAFTPFAIYCVVAGIAALVWLHIEHLA